ncbi:unnamed protein product [Trichobilharzia regenti]|nr:unnamed protein product [Trichobilharzia regenti]
MRVQLPVNWDSAVFYTLQRPGVGMGCFAYRLHLDDKYIHRKSLSWASNCWLASWIVNVQTKWYVYTFSIVVFCLPHILNELSLTYNC